MVSIMCTGMRMVRAWSAIARVIAWRIHHVAKIRFDQLALGSFSINISLNDLALSALEFGIADACFLLQPLQVCPVRALDATELFAGIFAARSLNFLFQAVDLAIEGPHGVYGFVHPVNQPLAFRMSEFKV